ncbi:hypothetical protein JTB14_035691 [Gonioctena quinquepunctata]|nr:hypothetical protein JTB14_035691 [Gonioctena quinquepunctata]
MILDNNKYMGYHKLVNSDKLAKLLSEAIVFEAKFVRLRKIPSHDPARRTNCCESLKTIRDVEISRTVHQFRPRNNRTTIASDQPHSCEPSSPAAAGAAKSPIRFQSVRDERSIASHRPFLHEDDRKLKVRIAEEFDSKGQPCRWRSSREFNRVSVYGVAALRSAVFFVIFSFSKIGLDVDGVFSQELMHPTNHEVRPR